MTTYMAFFNGKTIKRNSDREYTHAWRVTTPGEWDCSGFSSSLELAQKAAAAQAPHVYKAGSPASRDASAKRRGAFIARRTIEIVTVVTV